MVFPWDFGWGGLLPAHWKRPTFVEYWFSMFLCGHSCSWIGYAPTAMATLRRLATSHGTAGSGDVCPMASGASRWCIPLWCHSSIRSGVDPHRLPSALFDLAHSLGKRLLGLEFPQLASLVGDVMVPALIALQWILESLSTLPWVQISTNFFRPDAAPTTALMTVGVLCLIAGRIRWSISALAFGLFCSPDLGFDRGEKDAFQWDVLSVGNGSAHLLQMGSEAWLIDAGSSGSSKSLAAASFRPFATRISAGWKVLFATHADLDHIAGVVPILRSIPVGRLRIPPLMLKKPEMTWLHRAIRCWPPRRK